MTLFHFEKLVAEAMDELPAEFLEKLENVAVLAELWPKFHHLQSVNMVQFHPAVASKPDTVQPMSWRPTGMLFGLYQGVPRIKQQSAVFPPAKITLFAGPILSVSKDLDQIKAKIKEVLKHEVGHHFGMSEQDLRWLGY